MVRVLLINGSLVVSKLILLGLEDMNSLLTEVSSNQPIPKGSYDILFIDDSSMDVQDIKSIIGDIDVVHKILLSSSNKHTIKGITWVLNKPFLPVDITNLVQKKHKASKTSILDINEIESIKELLDDGLLEPLDIDILTTKKKKFKKIKRVDNFIEELFSMKTKKLKRLLEGAEINISIKFPKGES